MQKYYGGALVFKAPLHCVESLENSQHPASQSDAKLKQSPLNPTLLISLWLLCNVSSSFQLSIVIYSDLILQQNRKTLIAA